MPLMTVAELREQLRHLPQDLYVGMGAPDGSLTTNVLGPSIEAICSVTGDNPDEDEQAFIDEFHIVDWEMQVVALRPGRSPDDQARANEP